MRRVWVALLGLICSGAALAVEIIVVEDECRGRQLLLQGEIAPGDHDRIVARMHQLVAVDDLPDVQDPDVLWTVKLDSRGGDLDEAMRIGRYLRRVLATTEVGYRYARRLDGVWDYARSSDLVCLGGGDRLGGCATSLIAADCTGACLLIWLGGAERYALEGRLGTHGLAGAHEPVAAYMREMGAAVEAVPEPAPDADGWLDYGARRVLGGRSAALESLIAECPAPLTADESYASITDASAAVRDALMDRAEAHRDCRRRIVAEARAPHLLR